METTEELLDEVRALIQARERDGIASLAGRVSPAAWADVVPRLDPGEIAVLLQWLPDEEIPTLLTELDPAQAAAILRTLSRNEAADVLEAMSPDDATDVIAELPEAEAQQILVEMEPAEAAELRELAAYPPDTAGGIMTPAFTAVSPDLQADQAIIALRRVAEEAETVYYVYVLDPEEHLLGVLSLHSLVLAPPQTPVRALMIENVTSVLVDADQETAARLLTDHNLLALPVVDAENRLLGIITQDDVADVLEEEATEDIERLGGSQPLETSYRLAPVKLLVRRRVVWLLMLFLAEAYTGTVLRHYQTETEKVIALSFFVPLLIGTGGNVGSQTVTTLVRAMALGEVRLRDVRWVMAKEVAVATTMGVIMAVVAFGRSALLHVGRDVGYVVALTVFAICVWSATVAAVLPLILRKLRIDPAVVSAPLITTLVDGTGLVIYFSIAKVVLGL
ncbi:MAG TPA: magnesium transporter [Thermomicrobiales bacterium]|jgi:magnesium transporter